MNQQIIEHSYTKAAIQLYEIRQERTVLVETVAMLTKAEQRDDIRRQRELMLWRIRELNQKEDYFRLEVKRFRKLFDELVEQYFDNLDNDD